jgi:hypothetical protein
VLDGGLEFPLPLAVDEGVGDGGDGVCHRCVIGLLTQHQTSHPTCQTIISNNCFPTW